MKVTRQGKTSSVYILASKHQKDHSWLSIRPVVDLNFLGRGTKYKHNSAWSKHNLCYIGSSVPLTFLFYLSLLTLGDWSSLKIVHTYHTYLLTTILLKVGE